MPASEKGAIFWLADPASRELPAGRYEITDRTYAKVQIDSTRLSMNFEDHHKGIDLFYIFPSDAHQPVLAPDGKRGPIHKLIVKLPYSEPE